MRQTGQEDEKGTQGQDQANADQQKKSGQTTGSESRSSGEENLESASMRTVPATFSNTQSGTERTSDSLSNHDKIKERHEEQETHTQSYETDDLSTRPDQDQSDGALHPIQEGTERGGSSDQEGCSSINGEAVTASTATVQETTTTGSASTSGSLADQQMEVKIDEERN